MDYYEFMSRANFDCTRDTYNMIETVYINAPTQVVGKDVPSFIRWFNDNGQMKAVEGLYALCAAKVERDALRKEAKASNEKIAHLDRTVSEMMTEKGQLLTENEKLKQKVALYESLLSEEALVNMIVKDMDREGLIRLLMLKQGVKE